MFYWSQALWRKLQELGLAASYMNNDMVHRFCSGIMSLPFLAPNDIVGVFNDLKVHCLHDAKLKLLADYVDRMWIKRTDAQMQSCSHLRLLNICSMTQQVFNRVALSIQRKNKSHIVNSGTPPIYANYINKNLYKKSVKLDNI